MLLCPVCGQENPEIAHFCLSCGAALSSKPRWEERKVVSVLFADLVGFTSRTERLDPEDVRALLAPYWERLRGELERYGGTVEKFIGDAVMALFGAPTAHEDDPERAVRAALAIRDWARGEEELQVRIGVNTGEALVLLGARPAEGEGMAAGDVMNTAARLQSAAPVNGVLVGETTYRATRDVIVYAERQPVEAKGKAEPIGVWEALEARSRFGSDVEQQTLLPLVGRARELGAMLGAVDRARREREPQLVTLVGVPGIGKSRLVAELFQALHGGAELTYWRQGHCLPYGDGVSYWALVEMVKAQAGIRENDSAADAEAKLVASIEALVSEEEREWVTEHLLPLLGLGGDATRYGESFPAWRRYFERLAEQRPLILVFEDLHWADDGLLDFVDHLVEWSAGVPLVVFATARPELFDRRPGWGGGKLNAATLALTPLTDEQAAQIIQAVLEQSVLPAETQQALLERAGGNPLYAEQFARLYLERGSADDLPLPETVQGIVAARLDGLAPEEKQLVQDAAIFGKVFWGGAAAALSGVDAAISGRALHALERKGLVRRGLRSSVAGEDEYAFRHVLIRDVAYGQIPRSARVDRHLRAADWIEALGRLDDHAELLAFHLGSALELRRDDAELKARARVALWRGGRRALELHAYSAALRYCDAALELWPAEDPERAHVLAAQARARFRAEGDDAGLARAADELQHVGSVEAAAELTALAANAAWRAARSADARTLIERAEGMLSGEEPSAALASILAEKARLLALAEEPRAEEAAAAALEVAEHLSLAEPRASALGTRAILLMQKGSYADALALGEEALAAAPQGSPETMRIAINASVVAWAGGHPAALDVWLERALAAVRRAGDRPNAVWAEVMEVAIRFFLGGRWDEVLVRCDELIREFERSGGHYFEPRLRLMRAVIWAARDDVGRAQHELELALTSPAQSSDPQYTVPAALDAALICLLLDRTDEAGDHVAAALAALVPGRAYPFVGDHLTVIIRCGFAERARALLPDMPPGPRIDAIRLLLSGRTHEAADAFGRLSPYEEAMVRLLAAEQLAGQRRVADASAQLERGLAFFRAVGAHRVVRAAESHLAAAS